jgi:hypothetical protein
MIPDFLDVRHYKGGRSSASRTGRLHPQGNLWYSFLEAESTPGHMVPLVATEKIHGVAPPGIDPETFRPVAQCLNHYATPGPLLRICICSLFKDAVSNSKYSAVAVDGRPDA